jgi:phage baseplate assembly protein W
MGLIDLDLPWAGDLGVSAQGDLLTCTNLPLLKQRILRRIFTNKKALLFEPEYGAGLPQYVHEGISPSIYNEVKQRIIEEIYKEEAVARNPAPTINFEATWNGIAVSIVVFTTDSKQIALQFEVARQV